MDKERGSLGDRLRSYEPEPGPEVLAGLKENLARQSKPKRRPPVFWLWISALLIGAGSGIGYMVSSRTDALLVTSSHSSTVPEKDTSPNPEPIPSQTESIPNRKSLKMEEKSSAQHLPGTGTMAESDAQKGTENRSSDTRSDRNSDSQTLVWGMSENQQDEQSSSTKEGPPVQANGNSASNLSGIRQMAVSENRKKSKFHSGEGKSKSSTQFSEPTIQSSLAADIQDQSELTVPSNPEKASQKPEKNKKQNAAENREATQLISGSTPAEQTNSQGQDSHSPQLPNRLDQSQELEFLIGKTAFISLSNISVPQMQEVPYSPLPELLKDEVKSIRKWQWETRFNTMYSAIREINIRQVQANEHSRWLEKGGKFPDRMSFELSTGCRYSISEFLSLQAEAGLGWNREELYLNKKTIWADSLTATLSGNQILLNPVSSNQEERLRMDRFYALAGLGLNWKPSSGFPEWRIGAGYVLPVSQQSSRELNGTAVSPTGTKVSGSVYAWMGLRKEFGSPSHRFFIEPNVRYHQSAFVVFREGTRMRPFQVGLNLGWIW